MKNIIKNYISPSTEEKKALFKDCVFIFDTNVLLNLYRYSSVTRESLLNDISHLKGKLWLPHQIAIEYAENRYKVIYDTVDSYNALEKEGEAFANLCAKKLRIKISDDTVNKLKDSIVNWINEEKKINLIVTDPSDDEILNRLLDIYEDSVGNAYEEKELDKIKEEAQDRYKSQIPPGYCDKDKISHDSLKPYGDYIIWKEIKDYAKNNKKNIIFVTNDQKEDWWMIVNGKTIGPRIELREEFMNETGYNYYSYTVDSFIDVYSKIYGQIINEHVKDEIEYYLYLDKNIQSSKRVNNEEQIYDISNQIESIKNKRLHQEVWAGMSL